MIYNKKISIIIPCYNDGAFLNEVLSSINPDELPSNLEVIVVNDGSSDTNTLNILGEIVKQFSFVSVLHKSNGGLSSARNYGIRNSSGEFILPLDSDDLLEPSFVIEAALHLTNNPNTEIIFGNRRHFDGEDRIWKSNYDPIQQVYVNQLAATAMYRKSTFDKIGGYDESMKLGYEDWEFWIHAMSKGCNFYKLEMISYHYRIRSASMVQSITVKHHDEILTYIITKHLRFVMANYIELNRNLCESRNNYRVAFSNFLSVVKTKLFGQ